MSKLLNRSLRMSVICAAVILAVSIPVYYLIISRLWQYELNEHNITLSEKAGREDSFLIIGAVTILTVLFFGLLLLGLLLLNRRLSRQLWAPFYDSLSQIRDFDLHRHKAIGFGPTDITEFAELNAHLKKLIDSSISAYAQQKEFADNASHELQTPLAIVQSKLDLLLQSQSLTTDQYNIIEDAHKALTRVGRINKNLLLLARIDNNRYAEATQLEAAVILKKAIADFEPFILSKNLRLLTDISGPAPVNANEELVTILVHNLLNNAIRHSPASDTIIIRLHKRSLVFMNKGQYVLNSGQLFKRFGTASSETPGTGLGLALVKQIADRYGWQVTYRFENQQHSFSVSF